MRVGDENFAKTDVRLAVLPLTSELGSALQKVISLELITRAFLSERCFLFGLIWTIVDALTTFLGRFYTVLFGVGFSSIPSGFISSTSSSVLISCVWKLLSV